MPAVTTMVAVGALALGAKAGSDMKKAKAKELQQTRQAQQEAKTKALEAAKLRRTKEDAGAKVKVGASDASETDAGSMKKSAKARGTSGNVVGGVSVSTIGGL